MKAGKRGILWVTSGPSGAGKSTLLAEVLDRNPDILFSISATTRKPRPGEKDGVNYYFVSHEKFEKMIEEKAFLEWARVHDNYYGTPVGPVEEHLASGHSVILDIDVQGALQVKAVNHPDAVFVFIAPPSLAELRRRLEERKTEDEDKINGRLKTAEWELSRIHEYEYVVINDDLVTAVGDFLSIIRAEQCRVSRKRDLFF
ncbi:MAG: guanylate kinase [Candidatus Eremiobacteraeota bacterium]|nr:guanylate kinase [Candidatus Eremiobacteraeota bacterium]